MPWLNHHLSFFPEVISKQVLCQALGQVGEATLGRKEKDPASVAGWQGPNLGFTAYLLPRVDSTLPRSPRAPNLPQTRLKIFLAPLRGLRLLLLCMMGNAADIP